MTFNGTMFVISYDVGDDRRRRLLSRKLEGAARRVQKSVFETCATIGGARRIMAGCEAFIHVKEGDSLRFYKLSGDSVGCFANIGGPAFDWEADIIL
jgi:CRISPR-associated endonuclease Cas2